MTTDDTPPGDSDAPELERPMIAGQWARDAAAYLGGPAPEAPAPEPEPEPLRARASHGWRLPLIVGAATMAIAVGVFGVARSGGRTKSGDVSLAAATTPPAAGPVGQAPAGVDANALRDKAIAAFAAAPALRCDEYLDHGFTRRTESVKGHVAGFPRPVLVRGVNTEAINGRLAASTFVEMTGTSSARTLRPVMYVRKDNSPWYRAPAGDAVFGAFQVVCPSLNLESGENGADISSDEQTLPDYTVVGSRVVAGQPTVGIATQGATAATFWISEDGKAVMYEGFFDDASNKPTVKVRGFVAYPASLTLTPPTGAKPMPAGFLPALGGDDGTAPDDHTSRPTTTEAAASTDRLSAVDARSDLDDAIAYIDTLAANDGSYAGVSAAALNQHFPAWRVTNMSAITHGTEGSAKSPTVSLAVVSATTVRLWALSSDGTCWIVEEQLGSGAMRGHHAGDCTAAEPGYLSNANW